MLNHKSYLDVYVLGYKTDAGAGNAGTCRCFSLVTVSPCLYFLSSPMTDRRYVRSASHRCYHRHHRHHHHRCHLHNRHPHYHHRQVAWNKTHNEVEVEAERHLERRETFLDLGFGNGTGYYHATESITRPPQPPPPPYGVPLALGGEPSDRTDITSWSRLTPSLRSSSSARSPWLSSSSSSVEVAGNYSTQIFADRALEVGVRARVVWLPSRNGESGETVVVGARIARVYSVTLIVVCSVAGLSPVLTF